MGAGRMMMKFLVVLTGLSWMLTVNFVVDAGIPLDAVRKTLSKTADLPPEGSNNDVLPETVKVENKDDVEPLTNAANVDKGGVHGPNSVVEDKVNGTLPDKGIAKPVKNRKKNLNKSSGTMKSVLRNKLKSGKRKLKAKINYIDTDAAIPAQLNKAEPKRRNRTIDLSDIDDVLPDRLKKKYGNYVKQGRAKNIEELTNIRKKLKILRKVAGPKPSDAKINSTEIDAEGDDLLFQGDEELDAAQLDSIIASTARHYGVDMEPLKKYGIKNRSKRQAAIDPDATPTDRLWPQGAIKYYYDANVTSVTREIINEALANIRNQTCLWFKEDKTAVPRIQFVNWGTACAAPVGYYPNKDGTGIHKVKLAPCLLNYGTISHEILHALGIHHQQARSDRNEYLTNANAVGEEILDEYNSDNYGSPYDYGSVMHYGSKLKTTQELYQQTIGHRVGPSFTDIAVLNQRYNCFCEDPTVTCLNGGYPNPDDCDTCICPHGYGSRTCNTVDPGTEDESEIITVNSDECKTLEKSLGSDVGDPANFYQKAWFHFKAQSGKKVQLIFLKGSDSVKTRSGGCDSNGIEVKITKSKFNQTGFVFCGDNSEFVSTENDDIKTFTSSGNLAMIQLYTKKKQIDVVIKYRLVDSKDDEVPSSCFPNSEEDNDCEDFDEDCEYYNSQPDEDCEADPDWMSENCPKTCEVC